ncbi:unnamed protein product [Caenorhabditis nigoni]
MSYNHLEEWWMQPYELQDQKLLAPVLLALHATVEGPYFTVAFTTDNSLFLDITDYWLMPILIATKAKASAAFAFDELGVCGEALNYMRSK